MEYIQNKELCKNIHTKIKNITSLPFSGFTRSEFNATEYEVFLIVSDNGHRIRRINGNEYLLYGTSRQPKSFSEIRPKDVPNVTFGEVVLFVYYYITTNDYRAAYYFLEKLKLDDDLIFLKLLLIFNGDQTIKQYCNGIELSACCFRKEDDKQILNLCLKKNKLATILLSKIPDLVLTDCVVAKETLEALVLIKKYAISENVISDNQEIFIDSFNEKIEFIQSKLNSDAWEKEFPLVYYGLKYTQ